MNAIDLSVFAKEGVTVCLNYIMGDHIWYKDTILTYKYFILKKWKPMYCMAIFIPVTPTIVCTQCSVLVCTLP